MRGLHHGDVVAAARTLLASPAPERARLIRRIIVAADWADRHRRRHGRAHPRYGSGSLMAAAAAWPRKPEPLLDDPDYLGCLVCVLAALLARSAR